MCKRYPFDYAVVRVVPRVERGEFLNAGVILFSSTAAYLCARIELAALSGATGDCTCCGATSGPTAKRSRPDLTRASGRSSRLRCAAPVFRRNPRGW